MSNPDSDPNPIRPYLNPAYWNGRMVGQPDPDPMSRGLRLGQVGFANRTVAGYLAHRRAPYPLETFHMGDEVDASDYDPGTIFYGNREVLRVHGPLQDPYDGTEDGEDQPEPPTDTGFELLDFDDFQEEKRERLLKRLHLIQTDSIWYAAMRSFIVVTRGRRGKNNLQPVNEHTLYRMPDGSIVSGMAAAPIDNPILVGQTTHTKIGSHEQLHRVNTLMLSHEARATTVTTFAERMGSIGLNPFSPKP